jgi:hypothetical protein
MCPFCLANLGVMVAGAASTGGLAALAVKLSRKKYGAEKTAPNSNQRRNQDVDKYNRTPENSVAR